MNKIIIVNDDVIKKEISNNIKLNVIKKENLFEINIINIEIKESSDIFLNISIEHLSKVCINFNLLNDVNCNLFILTTGNEAKIKYTYNLNLNSILNVYKYNDMETVKEMCMINLNNKYARVNYILKSISKNKENYDYNINHNTSDTHSNIKNNCVNISGSMNIQISSLIPKDIINCTANQFNRIINLTNNKCEIRPILYIDNDNVDANHSALIGNFDLDELFYLQTMGISKKDAYNLLIKGFLLSSITNQQLKERIEQDIDKYWR